MLPGWLLLGLAITFTSANAGERLTIEDDRNPAYLPYSVSVIDSWKIGSPRRAIPIPVFVYRQGVSGRTLAEYVTVYNGDTTQHAPAQVSLLKYPGKKVISDRPLNLTITDSRAYHESGNDSLMIVGAGIGKDTLFVFRSSPGGSPTMASLGSVSDHNGDGFWDGQVMVRGLSDYDFDGKMEAFLAISAGKDLFPRQVASVELVTMTVEWVVTVSSQQEGEIQSCEDVSNPGVMFITYGPGHGAYDTLFDDGFGYLCKITSRGQVAFRYKVAGYGQHPILAKIPKDSLWVLWHVLPIGPTAAVDTAENESDGYISLVTRSGGVVKTIQVNGEPSSLWIGPFESHQEAIFALTLGGVVKIFTSSIEMIAESQPTQLRSYLGKIPWWPKHDTVYAIGKGNDVGFYSTEMRKLGVLGQWACNFEFLFESSSNNPVVLMASTPENVVVITVSKRSTWEFVKIFYLEYRSYVLSILLILLAGLLVSNFYRRRAKANLTLIARQNQELMATHEALKAAQAKIIEQEKFRQAQDIAGGLAHEIRNALFPADGVLIRQDKLLDSPQENAEAIRSLQQRLRNAMGRAMRLTDRVTAYTKLESQIQRQALSLREVLDSAIQANAIRLEQSKVGVQLDGNSKTAVVMLSDHIFSVLNNLMTNSIDALSEATNPEIKVRWIVTESLVCIDWSDNGCGIEEEVLPRVFDAFFSTKPTSGTGLGLSVVKRTIELYGGTIAVTSKLDVGTCFHIELPIN